MKIGYLRHIMALGALMGLFLALTPVLAEGKTSAQCGREYNQCQVRCNTDYKDDTVRRAPCVARCSGLFAACDAGVAYDKVKPWLEEQAQETKRFFDELLKKHGGEQQPDPQKKTKNNSI